MQEGLSVQLDFEQIISKDKIETHTDIKDKPNILFVIINHVISDKYYAFHFLKFSYKSI